MIRQFLVLMMVVLLTSCGAFAQGDAKGGSTAPATSPIELSAKVDHAKVMLGETVVLTIDVAYPPTLAVDLPAADKLIFSPLEVRDAVLTPMPLSGGRKHMRYTVHLAAADLGTQTIPAIKIDYKGADNTTQTAQSSPIPLEVVEAPAAATDKKGDIRDLKDLDDIATPTWVYVAAGAAGVLLLIGLGGFVAVIVKRLRRSNRPLPTPHEIALAALEQLTEANLPACGQLKAHYDRLACILREYLAQRFHLPVLEHTTAEVVSMMRDRAFEEALRMDVRTVLDEADLVKFAKLQVPVAKAMGQVQLVRAIVERTIPAPPVEGDGKPAAERTTQPTASTGKGVLSPQEAPVTTQGPTSRRGEG